MFHKHSIFIEQATNNNNNRALRYDLSRSTDVVNLYRNLDSIRIYGCGTFAQKAEEGITQIYQDIADKKWTRLTRGYSPSWIPELKRMKDEEKAAAKARAEEKAVAKAKAKAKAKAAAAAAAAEGEAQEVVDVVEEAHVEGDAHTEEEEGANRKGKGTRKQSKQAALEAAEYQGGPVQAGTSRKPITRAANKSANPGGQ